MKRTISNVIYCGWWDFIEIDNCMRKYISVYGTVQLKYVLTNSLYGNGIRGSIGRYIGYL